MLSVAFIFKYSVNKALLWKSTDPSFLQLDLDKLQKQPLMVSQYDY